jgi:hypothetical protein
MGEHLKGAGATPGDPVKGIAAHPGSPPVEAEHETEKVKGVPAKPETSVIKLHDGSDGILSTR